MKLISRLKENIKEMKEADAIVKSELDSDEEKKDDRIARITLIFLGIVLLALFIPNSVFATNEVNVYFFHKKTCDIL